MVNSAHLTFPRPQWPLVTREVLVESYEAGQPVQDLLRRPWPHLPPPSLEDTLTGKAKAESIPGARLFLARIGLQTMLQMMIGNHSHVYFTSASSSMSLIAT
jgi:hypothetical protein